MAEYVSLEKPKIIEKKEIKYKLSTPRIAFIIYIYLLNINLYILLSVTYSDIVLKICVFMILQLFLFRMLSNKISLRTLNFWSSIFIVINIFIFEIKTFTFVYSFITFISNFIYFNLNIKNG